MARLPETPEAVTAEWLNETLATRGRSARVASVRVVGEATGTNHNARLALESETGSSGPATVFGKFPPRKARQRELVRRSGMGRREVAFYAALAHDVPLRVPEPFLAEYDDTGGAFVLLLEDLEASGCRFPDPLRGVSIELAEQAMTGFAALHARFASRDARAGLPLEPMPRMFEYGVGMLEHALATRRDGLPDAFTIVAECYVEATAAIHDAWEAGPATLIHGDGHATNLFEDAGRPGFFDWGLVSEGPAMRDVSYFLCMSLDVELRRAHERELLTRYLDARAALGDTPPSLDDAFDAHRLHAAYTVPAGAPAAIQPPGDGPQQRYARVFVERASAAVDDLDALAALRDAIPD